MSLSRLDLSLVPPCSKFKRLLVHTKSSHAANAGKREVCRPSVGVETEQYCSLSTAGGRRAVRESLKPSWAGDSNIMLMQIRFGAHDGPICPTCNRQMIVNRRTPHPLYGSTYELQTFECRTCPYEIERSADRAGLPHASDAMPSGPG